MKLKLITLIGLLFTSTLRGEAQLFQIGDRTAADFISISTNFDNTISTDIRYKHITAPEGMDGPFSAPIASSIWVLEAGIGNNYHPKYLTVSPVLGIKWLPAIAPFVFAGVDYAYDITSNANNHHSLRYNYGISIWGMANIGISSNILATKQREGIQNTRHYLFMQIPISIISTNFFDRRPTSIESWDGKKN